MDCYNIIKDIFVPLAAASLGGAITLLGVRRTIINENQKAEKTYIESIRPYFVVETVIKKPILGDNNKTIQIEDDSCKNTEENDIIYHWRGLTITNVSENVCTIYQVRIGQNVYRVVNNVPIKAGETFVIKGYGMSWFLSKGNLNNIYIGVRDRQLHEYEYPTSFIIKDSVEDGKPCKMEQKEIVFTEIDCSYSDSEIITKGKKKRV